MNVLRSVAGVCTSWVLPNGSDALVRICLSTITARAGWYTTATEGLWEMEFVWDKDKAGKKYQPNKIKHYDFDAVYQMQLIKSALLTCTNGHCVFQAYIWTAGAIQCYQYVLKHITFYGFQFMSVMLFHSSQISCIKTFRFLEKTKNLFIQASPWEYHTIQFSLSEVVSDKKLKQTMHTENIQGITNKSLEKQTSKKINFITLHNGHTYLLF